MPAFSEIARQFARRLWQDENPSLRTAKFEYNKTPAQSLTAPPDNRPPFRYLGGLWQDDFLHGLLWHCSEPGSPIPYRGPTWSWVCRESAIYYNHNRLRIDDIYAQVLDVSVTVPGLNRYGRVTCGKVTILGPAAPILSSTYKDQSGTQFEKHFPYSPDWDLEGTPQLGCVLFRLQEQMYLILAPEARCHAGTYRRVGLIAHDLTNPATKLLDWQEKVIRII